jgi:class 3 adenylate cyclase
MRCPTCDHQNRSERRYCARCGAALGPVCAACGAANEPEDKFCGGCGVALPNGAAAPRAALAERRDDRGAVPTGERRQLTVLFCDMVGSTPLSQRIDVEEWRDVIAQYQQVTSAAVLRYGGHVAKFLGDGLLASLAGRRRAAATRSRRYARAGHGRCDGAAQRRARHRRRDAARRASACTRGRW